MDRAKLPWYVAPIGVMSLAVVLAIAANWFLGNYFERTYLDEASPLVDAPPAASQGTPVPAMMPADAPTAAATEVQQAGVLLRGEVRDGEPGHHGEGVALIVRDEQGRRYLRFEGFSVTNGPDLFVVLSTDPGGYAGEGAINLGGLKATDGNINYEIPPDADLSRIGSAVIWCRAFDIDFAVASLEPDP